MSILSIRQLKKSYGDNELLQDLSLDLEAGEHVALVGNNGAGKSTLLHLLAGMETPDSGQIRLSPPTLRIALLEQCPIPDAAPASEPLFRSCLSALGFTTQTALASDLSHCSGGEQMKLALSRLLAQEPDFLLLDEPTNHLDLNGVEALIDLLNGFPGTLLVVSHDRYFLDCTVSCVWELEDGRLHAYPGNYTDYRNEKARLFEENLHRWESGVREQQRLDASIRRAKGWAEKAHRDSTKKDDSGLSMGVKEGKRKKAEKLERAAQNQIRRLERLKQDVGERPRPEAQIRFAVDAAEKRGKRILEVFGLKKSFGDRILFSDSSFTLSRGEHVALFGQNGCGKTTFLRILAQELAPDAGSVRLSPSCRPFLLWQDFSLRSDPAAGGCSPLQYFSREFGGLTGEQRTLLANMGLTARHMRQPISTLSYGEQMKLRLAELIFSRRDFLVLDEPTNYLDLHARETLEQALSSYDGTLLLVSHDLYFLKAVCDRVLLMKGGRIQRLECSFAEYLERRGHTREP